MSKSGNIEHIGVVNEINGNLIKVSITAHTSCSGCHAKSVCGMADEKTKIISIYQNSEDLAIGEQVIIILKQSLGLKAVFFGYVLPFILIISILLTLMSFGVHELKSGLIALGALIPYYSGLFLFKNKFDKTFSFALKKFN